MLRHIIIYGLGALAIIGLLLALANSFKENDALSQQLTLAQATLEEKNKEMKRVEEATFKRDEAYEEHDRKLDGITQRIRNLSRGTEKPNRVLSMPLPSDAVRLLRD